jgi:hypothetical protein
VLNATQVALLAIALVPTVPLALARFSSIIISALLAALQLFPTIMVRLAIIPANHAPALAYNARRITIVLTAQ